MMISLTDLAKELNVSVNALSIRAKKRNVKGRLMYADRRKRTFFTEEEADILSKKANPYTNQEVPEGYIWSCDAEENYDLPHYDWLKKIKASGIKGVIINKRRYFTVAEAEAIRDCAIHKRVKKEKDLTPYMEMQKQKPWIKDIRCFDPNYWPV